MTDSAKPVALDDLVGLAKWQGSVDTLLAATKDSVQELRTCSASKGDVHVCGQQIEGVRTQLKEDLKGIRIQMEKDMERLEKSIIASISALKIDALEGRVGIAEKQIGELSVAFKIKSSVWGLLGGLIPAIGALLYTVLQK